MAENPLLGFFESLGAGMEAGQQRRTLMQRARQGEAVDVPGLGMTALMGAVRAATPASTRLAQDKLKLEIANQALDQQIFEAKQQAAEAEKITLKTKAKAEAEAERDNSVLFADLLSRAESDLSVGKFDTLSGIKKEASALPVAQQVQLNSAIGDLTRTYDLQKGREYNDNKEILGQYLSPEDVNKLGPLQAQTLVEIISGRYQSGIGQMVGDFNNLNALGLTNLSALVIPAIEKQARSVGQVIEMDPTTGQITMREEVIGGPGVDISKTEEAERSQEEESAEILFSTIDQTRALVERDPNIVGITGEFTGGINILKELVRPLYPLPPDPSREQVESAFAKLKTQALMSLGGGSLARLTDKDAKILEQNIPQLSMTDSPTKVLQVMDQLEGTISLRYLLNRSRLDTLDSLVNDLGPARVAKLAGSAKTLNFKPSLVDDTIREAIVSINSEADRGVADQNISELFLGLADAGYSQAEVQPYLDLVKSLASSN